MENYGIYIFFIIGLIDNVGYQWVYPPGASNVASCEFMYKALYINVYYKLEKYWNIPCKYMFLAGSE